MTDFLFDCYARMRREEQDRKREEEKERKQRILEQYRLRKAQEADEQDGGSIKPVQYANSLKDGSSSFNSRTVVLNRRGPLRPNSAGNMTKPRPKSLHVNSNFMQDFASLEKSAAKARDAIDSGFSLGGGTDSLMTLHPAGVPSSITSSRPQSALSSNSRRMPSPPSASTSNLANRSNHGLPPLPSSHLFLRPRGPPSDGASDVGSAFSEYTGPKLFVKPTQK